MDPYQVKGHGVTVLVVEDEALIRLEVVGQLHGRG